MSHAVPSRERKGVKALVAHAATEKGSRKHLWLRKGQLQEGSEKQHLKDGTVLRGIEKGFVGGPTQTLRRVWVGRQQREHRSFTNGAFKTIIHV